MTQDAQKPVALVVDACTPLYDRDSGSQDTLQYIQALQHLGFHVVFVPFACDFTPQYTPYLEAQGVECIYPPRAHSLQEAIRKEAPRARLVLVFRHTVLATILPNLRECAPDAKVILETVDLHHLREMRQAELGGDDEMRRAALNARDNELDMIAQSDAAILLSQYELDYLASLPAAGNLVHIPIARDIPPQPTSDFQSRRDILFIGVFRHPPNADGICWFTNTVWPLITAKDDDIKLHIVGAYAPDSVSDLASDKVLVHGHLPDLAPLMQSVRVGIAPLRYGAGLKGKIITTLGNGVPVVSTSVGVEGASYVPGTHVLVADEPQAFANSVLALYREEVLWQALASKGRDFVTSEFSVAAFRDRFAALLSDLGVTP